MRRRRTPRRRRRASAANRRSRPERRATVNITRNVTIETIEACRIATGPAQTISVNGKRRAEEDDAGLDVELNAKAGVQPARQADQTWRSAIPSKERDQRRLEIIVNWPALHWPSAKMRRRTRRRNANDGHEFPRLDSRAPGSAAANSRQPTVRIARHSAAQLAAKCAPSSIEARPFRRR